jgi:hypothetical protein
MPGAEPINGIAPIAEAEAHHPDLHLHMVRFGSCLDHAAGGLTENDFVLAADHKSSPPEAVHTFLTGFLRFVGEIDIKSSDLMYPIVCWAFHRRARGAADGCPALGIDAVVSAGDATACADGRSGFFN